MENAEYRTRLEAELANVIAQLTTIAVQDQETGDWEALPSNEEADSADENTEADAMEDSTLRNSIVAELETRYRNITRALVKISEGTYGMCEISGEPIETERLMVNPAARTNIANRDRERELPL
jgi:DnaK suppressor protein